MSMGIEMQTGRGAIFLASCICMVASCGGDPTSSNFTGEPNESEQMLTPLEKQQYEKLFEKLAIPYPRDAKRARELLTPALQDQMRKIYRDLGMPYPSKVTSIDDLLDPIMKVLSGAADVDAAEKSGGGQDR